MKNLTIIFFLFSISLQAQDSWEHFYKGEIINDILETSDQLYVATSVGLLKVEKATNQFELLTVFNSALNNNYVRSIIQDHDEMIWIKTNLGVSKYDGANWIHFTPDNSILENDDPTETYYGQTDQLYVDGENRVWTKNNDRLLFYKNGNWTSSYDASSLIHFRVNPNGGAWLLYYSTSGVAEKLKRFDGNNWIVQDALLPPDVFATYLSIIDFDNENNLWFYTNGISTVDKPGMVKWDATSQDWSFFPRDTSITDGLRSHIVDFDNNVWTFNPYENELIKFSAPATWEKIPLPDSLINSLVHEVVATENGIAFLMTDDFGNEVHYLGFLDTLNQLEIIPTPFQSKTRKQKLTHLSDGSIFMGGVRAQPTIYKNGQFESYDIGNADLPADILHQIVGEDATGKKYFNIANASYVESYLKSFVTFENQTWNIIDYPVENDEGIARIKQNGEIWFGTNSNAFSDIYIYKNDIWELLDIQSQPFNDHVIQEFEIDQQGSLWLTAEDVNSLFKLENDIWKEYNFASLGMFDQSYQIYGFDKKDQIWIDSRYGYQTYLLNNLVDTFELALSSIDPQDIFSNFLYPSYGAIKIKEQANGNVFFMRENRLIRYDGTELIFYDSNNSPFDWGVTLNNIQKDSMDNIWLATSSGAYKFDGDSTWVNYTPHNSPLADIVVKDIFIDRDNKIWMIDSESGIYTLTEEVSSPTENIAPISDFSFSIFPNPFSYNITLTYDLEKNSNVKIEVIDLTGRIIQTHLEGEKMIGQHQLKINLPNLAQGVYFCKIIIGKQSEVLKVVKI